MHTEKFTVNRASGPVEFENVVGQIRGREKPDEFVLLGAHLDSRNLGTEALDNGCDVAMVIDAAPIFARAVSRGLSCLNPPFAFSSASG